MFVVTCFVVVVACDEESEKEGAVGVYASIFLCFNLDHAADAAVEKEMSCRAESSVDLVVVSCCCV